MMKHPGVFLNPNVTLYKSQNVVLSFGCEFDEFFCLEETLLELGFLEFKAKQVSNSKFFT